MIVQIARSEKDLMFIKAVALEWQDSCNADSFGVTINANSYMAGIIDLISNKDTDVLLLCHEDEVVGYMGIERFSSPLGTQKIANEQYWYILPGTDNNGAVMLLKAAQQWAKGKGCSHLIMNASMLASDKHDRLCGLYGAIGMKKFETSYIKEIQ